MTLVEVADWSYTNVIKVRKNQNSYTNICRKQTYRTSSIELQHDDLKGTDQWTIFKFKKNNVDFCRRIPHWGYRGHTKTWVRNR